MALLNLRATYKDATVQTLENFTFPEAGVAMKEIRGLPGVEECLILQTCNRVEIFAVSSEPLREQMERQVTEYWRERSGLPPKKFHSLVEKSWDGEALSHIMKLAAGLESMIVGENQVLGQIRDSMKEANANGTFGLSLDLILNKALRTGVEVRDKTDIGRGTVSIGSAAVELVEELLGGLEGRKVLMIGSGEIGRLVGKALVARDYRGASISVCNRTYWRGVKLAEHIGGVAIKFEEKKDAMAESDVVIVATTAPHNVVTRAMVEEVLSRRGGRRLLIIDLSQPRNVEESVGGLPGVDLRNIDDLRGIAEQNLKSRLSEAKRAEKIVEGEVKRLELLLKRRNVEPLISALFVKAEKIRNQEVKKALKILGETGNGHKEVIDKLTRVVIERTLAQPVANLRKAAEAGDSEAIISVQKLFDLEFS